MHYAAEWLSLKSPDGVDLKKFIHQWDSSNNPAATNCTTKGTIALIHGLGEHGGRYNSLATRLVADGFRVVSMDQQGHGVDPRAPGFVDSYDALLDDITGLLSWINSKFGNNTILLGHSMGGNLAINHALRIGSGYRGVISSGPMLLAQRAPGPIVELLLRIWSSLRPRASMKSKVIAERLMIDPDEIASFREDKLFHSTLSLKLGAALIDSGRWALANAGKLEIPLLLAHGDTDALTCPNASKEFAQRAGKKCELKIWEGFLHDPFRCLGGDQVVASFVNFANRQLALEPNQ